MKRKKKKYVRQSCIMERDAKGGSSFNHELRACFPVGGITQRATRRGEKNEKPCAS